MRGATLANKVDQIAASWLMGHLDPFGKLSNTKHVILRREVRRSFSLLEMGDSFCLRKCQIQIQGFEARDKQEPTDKENLQSRLWCRSHEYSFQHLKSQ